VSIIFQYKQKSVLKIDQYVLLPSTPMTWIRGTWSSGFNSPLISMGLRPRAEASAFRSQDRILTDSIFSVVGGDAAHSKLLWEFLFSFTDRDGCDAARRAGFCNLRQLTCSRLKHKNPRYSNTTVYYGIHESSECIPVDSGVTNLIHDCRSCVDFTFEVEASVA